MSTHPSPNKTSLSATKVADLKTLCSKHGLTVSGNKSDLVNRLLAHFETIQTSSSPRIPANKDLAPPSTLTPAMHSTTSNPPPVSDPTPQQKNTPNETIQSTTPQNVHPTQTNPGVTPASGNPQQDPNNDEEEKRKQRAERFGLAAANGTGHAVSDENEIKKLERAKRFGISNQVNPALDKPLQDGKHANIKSTADLEWEARKRKRAEKFGLVDNPPVSNHKDFHRRSQKFNGSHPKH